MINKHSTNRSEKIIPASVRIARVISTGNGTVDVSPIGSSVVLHDIPVSGSSSLQNGDTVYVQMIDNKRMAFPEYTEQSRGETVIYSSSVVNAGSGGGGGAMEAHAMSGGFHFGEITTSQATWAALKSTVITAGAGLSGGGTLASNFTINVGAGNGIEVDTNSVSVKLAATSGLSFATDALQIDDSIAGNGLTILSKALSVGAGNGIDVSADSISVKRATTSGLLLDANGLAVGAGNGISVLTNSVEVKPKTTSGLVLDANGLAVGAGNGISVLTDTVAVNQAYAFTWSAAHTFSARPTFSAGATISAGQTLRFGADVDLQRKAANILSLASGDNMESTTFQSGVSGWQITSAGDAEFNNVRVRGELSASVFTLNEIAASAGTLGVFKSAGVLWSDFTTPSAVGNSGTLLAKNSDAAAPLFAVGDRLEIKAWTGTAIVDIWLEVTARTNNTTHTSYSVTLRSGSTGVVIPAGVAIADWGPSGSGAVTLSADGTIGASANLSVQSHTGSPWSARTLHLRLGNLNGSYGYNTAVYGFAAGDSATTFVAVDSSDGFRVVRDSTTRFQVNTAGELTIRNTSGVAVITMDSTSARIDNVLQIGTSGEIRQGTGSLTASPATYTGLRIWAETSGGNLFGRIGGYNSGTLQWYAGTDGKLYAGAGTVSLGLNGFVSESSSLPVLINQVPQFFGNYQQGLKFAEYVQDSNSVYGIIAGTGGSDKEVTFAVRDSSGYYSYIKPFAGSNQLGGWSGLEVSAGYSTQNGSNFSRIYLSSDHLENSYVFHGYLSSLIVKIGVFDFGTSINASDGTIRTGDLYLGSSKDVRLYRSAANMLRTPDSATIDGGLNVGAYTGAGAGDVHVQNQLGVGTDSPSGKVDIVGAWRSQLTIGSGANAGAISFRRGDSTIAGYVGFAAASEISEFNFHVGSGGGYFTWDININGGGIAEAMRLSNLGRLGIGTNNPQYAVDAASGSINTEYLFRVSGTQVVGARITGWGNNTGTLSRAAFDTGTVTTAQLAQRVAQLIADLKTHGLIGGV